MINKLTRQATISNKTTQSSIRMRMSRRSPLGFVLSWLLLTATGCLASGVFEINISSLIDSQTGRDLREDCCSWQNNSNQNIYPQHLPSNILLSPNENQQHQQQHQQQQQCDPSKCQLIIRVCVKNYQTQIESNQCTFGELTAQVMKPNEPNHYPYFPTAALTTSTTSRPSQSIRSRSYQQQQVQASSAVNIHYQRMLYQQQLQSYNMQTTPLHQYQMRQHQRLLQQAQQGAISSGQLRAMRTMAFHQPISFPFNFTWPGSFSLVVDAWYESPTGLQQVSLPFSPMGAGRVGDATTYDLYRKQLIIKHSMHGYLSVKNEWTNEQHKTDAASLSYSYRVTCQPNYYGEQCNILCRPRDDIYGHYTCSQTGSVVCLPGWQGSYCLEPICSPGCQKHQGNCSRPNECNCRFGWQGASCEQCTRYPGCVHGYCNKPHECICEEGWGGLLCNEDLNFCTNHQPCKNGALCTNAFDSNGVGSYTCACSPGFYGKNCDKRVSTRIPESHHQQVAPANASVSRPTPPVKQASSNSEPQHPQSQPAQLQQPLVESARPVQSLLASHTNTAALLHSYQQPPDYVVITAYVIIVVSIVIILVLFLLRTYLDQTNQRQWWQQESSRGEDVATLQNHQNIYKSRTSLSVPGGNTNDKMLYDALDSGCSSASSSMASTPHNTADRRLMSRYNHQRQAAAAAAAQVALQHHLSQPNLGPASGAPPLPTPPPPYTISSHNLAAAAAGHYTSGPTTGSLHYNLHPPGTAGYSAIYNNSQAAATSKSTTTSIYNNSQSGVYGQTGPAGSSQQQAASAAEGSSKQASSSSGGVNSAAPAAGSSAHTSSPSRPVSNHYGTTYQSPYYVIYYGHPYMPPR